MYKNKDLRERILEQFLLTKIEILMIILLTSVLLMHSVYTVLRGTSESLAGFDDFSENLLSDMFAGVTGFLGDTVITADVATMIVWAIVGAISYSVAISAVDAVRKTRGTFRSAFDYSHPKGFNSKNYFLSVTVGRALHTLGVFAIILYTITLINTFIPVLHQGINRNIEPLSSKTAWVGMYILIFAVCIHSWAVILRLVRAKHLHAEADLLA